MQRNNLTLPVLKVCKSMPKNTQTHPHASLFSSFTEVQFLASGTMKPRQGTSAYADSNAVPQIKDKSAFAAKCLFSKAPSH